MANTAVAVLPLAKDLTVNQLIAMLAAKAGDVYNPSVRLLLWQLTSKDSGFGNV